MFNGRLKITVCGAQGLTHIEALQKMGKQYGLTGPQSLVLRLLIKEGALSSADLSRQMYVTPSNITGIIDRL